jgi:hypothetical protein
MAAGSQTGASKVTASPVVVAQLVAALMVPACGAPEVTHAPAKQSAQAEFDNEAAATALSKAAAAARECSGAADPHGKGRILVSFAADGHVFSAVIEPGGLTGPDGRPSATEVRGTSVGNCVEGLFRKTRVPPFSGPTVSVHRIFWL